MRERHEQQYGRAGQDPDAAPAALEVCQRQRHCGCRACDVQVERRQRIELEVPGAERFEGITMASVDQEQRGGETDGRAHRHTFALGPQGEQRREHRHLQDEETVVDRRRSAEHDASKHGRGDSCPQIRQNQLGARFAMCRQHEDACGKAAIDLPDAIQELGERQQRGGEAPVDDGQRPRKPGRAGVRSA